MFFIKMHSFVDVITNSSTVIYTNSNGCVEPIKEMLAEMLRVFNVDENVDDIFDVYIVVDNNRYADIYETIYDQMEDDSPEKYPEYGILLDHSERWSYITSLMNNAFNGLQPMPEWAKNIKVGDEDETYVVVFAKDQKYKKLCELIHDVVYSTDHDAEYDG